MPPRLRTAAFALLPALALLAAGEAGLRLLDAADPARAEDPFAGFEPRAAPSFIPHPDEPDWVIANPRNPMLRGGLYRRERAPGRLRAVVLGGSNVVMFDAPRLAAELRRALGREAEIVNAGGSSYGSERVALIAEEAARVFRPDLFILYLGHNEFIERNFHRGLLAEPASVRALRRVLWRSRLYVLLRSGVRALRRATVGLEQGPDPTAPPALGVEPTERMAEWADVELVYERMRANLDRIAAVAARAGAPLLVVTPVGNLTLPPIRSCFRTPRTAAERDEHERRWRAALGVSHEPRLALAPLSEPGPEGASPEALAALLREYGPHAGVEWGLGRALLARGEGEAAARWIRRSHADDCAPWSAGDRAREVLRAFAVERGLRLVDAEAAAAARAPNGITGYALLEDNCHLKAEGQALVFGMIADAAAEMAARGELKLAGAGEGA